MEYFSAMLAAGVPNIEMHIYGNGRHPGDPLPDGSRMSGGLTDRNNIPYGSWQYRFIDWFRDLGFLQKPGVETKAAKDIATFVSQPVRPPGQGQGSGVPPNHRSRNGKTVGQSARLTEYRGHKIRTVPTLTRCELSIMIHPNASRILARMPLHVCA